MGTREIEKARRVRVPEHRRVFGVEVRDHGPVGPPGGDGQRRDLPVTREPGLGQLAATSICGNDITSSCLYVAAICTVYAGWLSPLCLVAVAGLLYLFRKVYGEVGEALPLNGGAYNALLNSSTKFNASLAACLTILSYMATAVISSKTAMEYASRLLPPWPWLEGRIVLPVGGELAQGELAVIGATVVVLGVFALLAIIGITESSRVAMAIFAFHMLSLAVFCVLGIVRLATDPAQIVENFHQPLPGGRGVAMALFFGFSSGLLGISGFESSANFIEEQKPGVFVATLRNMWVAVGVFNPLIALLALAVLPVARIQESQDFLLHVMARSMGGGGWLPRLVAIDATLVLCGAVLTSFVGVGGLVRRMALDRTLPQFLLRTNRRGTTHNIFLIFLALCASVLLITRGRLLSLAGVYTIAFLGVMTLFAVGNMLLKARRAKLLRPVVAGWGTVLVAALATVAGILGNIAISPHNLLYFCIYFAITVLAVGAMFLRIQILRLVLHVASRISRRVQSLSDRLRTQLVQKIDEINSLGIIYFTKGDDLANLNRALLYVRNNESTKLLRVVHVYREKSEIPPELEKDLELLDEVYPEIKIEFILRQGRFDPDMIESLSRELGVAKNYMFIGAPGEKFPYGLRELGGVRLII